MGIISLMTGKKGPSGFGSGTTAQQVTDGIDATNLTVIITGGASGIGLETARVLALRKAHVIIAARNMDAANEAKEHILEEDKTARVDVLKLDLSSLQSVRAFVNEFNALKLPLNILINNAGVMFCPFQLSKDGIEMQFATNHLGHFLLTNLLLDKMKQTAKDTGIEGRIVNLTSIAHHHTYEKGIQFEKINDKSRQPYLPSLFVLSSTLFQFIQEPTFHLQGSFFYHSTSYSDKKAYGQSKLANILHANELARRLKEEGANITANSVHPGLIITPLWRHSALLMTVLKVFTHPIWKNVPQGASTTCYIALHPAIKGVTGKYYYDCNESPSSSLARNEVLAKELWDLSNKMVNSVQNC